ncbi:MAG: hypothetical protein KBS35_00175 [Mycoplasma sp.]|nr:hypothetical protein [Candidatus Hennigella equi]
MKNFFERAKSQNYESIYLPNIEKVLNLSNLDVIKKQKVLSLYDTDNAKDFLAYRFSMLKQWMKKNKQYTKEYIVALDEMIDKLYLSNELNSFELQYIKNTQATVFAMSRNLKQLIVDFSINKNEYVFYRYNINSFKLIRKKGLIQKTDDVELYITTQRIILSKHMDIISIYYKDIESYHYGQGKLFVVLNSKNKCYIDSDNNREIVESLKRVLKREKIELK